MKTSTVHSPRSTEKGVVLILTLLIMAGIITVIAAFLYMTAFETKGTGFNLADAKALWIAEGGIQQVIYKLRTDSSYRAAPSPNPLTGSLGDGDYSVQVTGPSDSTYTLESTGTVGIISRKITQSVVATSTPEAFEYAFHGGKNIDFDNSSGTVNGADVSAVNKVNNETHMNFGSGVDVIEYSTVTDPAVDLATYAAIATDTVSGKKTFTSGTWSGIWYVTGNVTIEDEVTFNGTIVSEGKIETDSNANIILNPSAPYPALITGSDKNINLDIKESTINGLIYSGKNITIDGNNKSISFNGSLIAANNINISKANNTTFTYDSGLFSNPPPGFSGGGSVNISAQDDWAEVTPAT